MLGDTDSSSSLLPLLNKEEVFPLYCLGSERTNILFEPNDTMLLYDLVGELFLNKDESIQPCLGPSQYIEFLLYTLWYWGSLECLNVLAKGFLCVCVFCILYMLYRYSVTRSVKCHKYFLNLFLINNQLNVDV